jgi:hypothetical protein
MGAITGIALLSKIIIRLNVVGGTNLMGHQGPDEEDKANNKKRY